MRRVAALVHGLRGSDGYGVVLGLLVITLVWGIAAPAASWSRIVLVALQGLTLVTALWTSRTRSRRVGWAAVLAVLAVLVAAGAIGVGDRTELLVVGGMSLALVAGTPIAMTRSLRELGRVTTHAITAALCVYLLFAMFFAALYMVVGAASGTDFFTQTPTTTYSDYLYFGAITQTTVGYGDLAPATNAGRAFASVQAMFGQIYLVTIVALIVGNLGRQRAPRTHAFDD